MTWDPRSTDGAELDILRVTGHSPGSGDCADALQGALRSLIRELASTVAREVATEMRQVARENLSAWLTPEHTTNEPGVELLSTGAAARVEGVSPKTIRKWIADGRLPARRIGREYRIRREDLQRAGSRRKGANVDADALADQILRRSRKSK